jgi:catechol 2,3-dioxygenase-like lactoylglutathione lyase family enzyme
VAWCSASSWDGCDDEESALSLSLNHYAIRTHDLEACRRFYVEALGLAVGPRPDFPFPGLWLYAGDTAVWANAVVHIIGIDRDDPEGLQRYLGERDTTRLHGSGALDHVAFFATGLAARRAILRRLGIALRERTVPGLGLHQLFVEDPNGIVVELNYPAAEAAA